MLAFTPILGHLENVGFILSTERSAMLTLRAVKKTMPSGDRIELILKGRSLPPQLHAEPIFFELFGSEATDLSILDGFAGAVIHFAMNRAEPLHVEGRLTRSCVRYLTDYQKFWALVRPGHYSVINVTADEIVEDCVSDDGLPAVAAYSGGVDSSFTIARHVKKLIGTDVVPLDAVMIVHGFDVPLSDEAGFGRLLDRLQPVTEEFGLRRYVARTNIKQLGIQHWEDSHPSQIVACLHLVAHRHRAALIADDGFEERQPIPWGGNPISVPKLTTGRMKVIYDGAGHGRFDKIRLLAGFPTICRALKFCWRGLDADKNCGRCNKCIRTYWGMRTAGIENPECFDIEMSDDLVESFTVTSDVDLAYAIEQLEVLKRISRAGRLPARIEQMIAGYESTRVTRYSSPGSLRRIVRKLARALFAVGK